MDIKPSIKERIINAANYLVAQGNEKPTNEQVRERLGSGSLSHISPVMREWRESRRVSINTALDMPEELTQAIQMSISQIWAVASQLASTKTEEIQVQAQESITEMQAELSEALAEVARLEKALSDQTKLAEQQFADISRLSEELRASRSENQRLTITSESMETRLSEYQGQIDGLQADLRESRQENKELQKELIDIVRKRDDT